MSINIGPHFFLRIELCFISGFIFFHSRALPQPCLGQAEVSRLWTWLNDSAWYQAVLIGLDSVRTLPPYLSIPLKPFILKDLCSVSY